MDGSLKTRDNSFKSQSVQDFEDEGYAGMMTEDDNGILLSKRTCGYDGDGMDLAMSRKSTG